jgi:hypothetical protein
LSKNITVRATKELGIESLAFAPDPTHLSENITIRASKQLGIETLALAPVVLAKERQFGY